MSRTLCVFTQVQMQPMVLPNATVVIGYCFGGSAVLDLAASWPSMTDGVQGKPCMAFKRAAHVQSLCPIPLYGCFLYNLTVLIACFTFAVPPAHASDTISHLSPCDRAIRSHCSRHSADRLPGDTSYKTPPASFLAVYQL